MRRAWLQVLLILSLTLVSATPAIAQEDPSTPDSGPTIYVPYSASASNQRQFSVADAGVAQVDDATVAAASEGSPADKFKLASVIVVLDGTTSLDAVAGEVGAQVVHRYKNVFNGGSMVLPEGDLSALAATTGVARVYIDKLEQPSTDTSPGFIGATDAWQQLGGKGKAGEGVVVGILDTGIWPEHPSLSDPDPYGKAYPTPPVTGLPCNFGNTTFNPNDAPFACNKKLIGAYSFIDTYKAVLGLLPTEFDSARDDNGHGTHTATTSAGNGGVTASIYGRNLGRVSGIAPRAHVIAYRVCADQGCFNSDSVAAIDQAIADGVDVINFSISGGESPFSDAVELAFLNAYNAGVFVAASAGNSGPTPDTVAHRGPWVTTVAASTTDRHFLSTVSLVAPNGDKLRLTGATVTDGITTPTPVVYDPAQVGCAAGMPAVNPPGAIFICQRGGIARVLKSYNASVAGAGGMLLYNAAPQGLNTDNHFIPSLHLDKTEGDALIAFMVAHPIGVVATFPKGTAQRVRGDVMAPFSSRGGPAQNIGVSKPDVTAPGVQILAGNTPMPATPEGGYPGQLFQSIQGTSMSSPHVAGAGALLKDMRPDWTPGQIKSALMMTAKIGGVVNDGGAQAGPFEMGSGRIDLRRAGSAEFTISESGANFLAYEDALWKANYPSLFIPSMPGRVTVQRTLHNETGRPQTWQLRVLGESRDFRVSVPHMVRLNPGGNATFDLTVDASAVPQGEVRSALLVFSFGHRTLTFPITIVRGQADVAITKVCAPSEIGRGQATTCTVSMTNNSFDGATVSMTDRVPRELRLNGGSVTGGATASGNNVAWSGALAGQQAPTVAASLVSAGVTPGGGYLPLSIFGIAPIAGVGDESISNFNVPAFVFAGETWTRIAMVSNGYAVAGGGTGADVNYINSPLPNPTLPNNVLSPFWTDLNPGAGGAMRIGVLTDGVDNWIVLDWEGVPNWSGSGTNSFQIWIGTADGSNTGEDITFTYGAITAGEGGFLTIGAENKFGNSGQAVYFDGTGTLPTAADGVLVSSTPGAPGETKVITFQATGDKKGSWTNCAEMTGNIFENTAIACSSGKVRH